MHNQSCHVVLISRASFWSLGFVLAFLSGCNRGPFTYTPVSGTVTYESGEVIPASSIKLIFKSLEVPADPKIRPRPAQAGVDTATGSFAGATSQKPNDGLVPGRHKVTIIGFDANGQLSRAIPDEYANGATTPIVVSTDDRPLEIKIRKP